MRIPRNTGGGAAPAKLISALTVTLTFIAAAAANYMPPLEYAAVERRQQTTCPANYVDCESQGAAFAGICCAYGQNCALDQSNSPACCPSGAVCTGAVTGTATTLPTNTVVSYVSNAYFAFPAIATSFSNAGACSRAVTACSSNYALCTSDLASGTGGYAVTISVPGGGGVTVQPTHTQLASASAVSICASLSTQACSGLAAGMCATAGTTTGGFVIGTANAAGPRVTGTPCLVGVAAGVGLGVLAGAGL